jgi:hypothetical protein
MDADGTIWQVRQANNSEPDNERGELIFHPGGEVDGCRGWAGEVKGSVRERKMYIHFNGEVKARAKAGLERCSAEEVRWLAKTGYWLSRGGVGGFHSNSKLGIGSV